MAKIDNVLQCRDKGSDNQVVAMGIEKIRALGKDNHALYDLKYLFDKEDTDIRLCATKILKSKQSNTEDIYYDSDRLSTSDTSIDR